MTANQMTNNKFKYLYLLIFLGAVSVFSSLCFINTVSTPVFDDTFNIIDVQRYVAEGVSSETIRQHVNSPGPTSYLWIGIAAKQLGNSLSAYRIGALISWVLLITIACFLAIKCKEREWILVSAITALTFPHATMSMSLVLTEGPALMFACTGSWLWINAYSKNRPGWSQAISILTGGLLMGLSVTARQYYLALLPSMVLFAFFHHRENEWQDKRKIIITILSIMLATAPCAYLFSIWGGASSPGMSSGASYSGIQAGIGLSISRPVIVLFYITVYFLPYTTGLWLREKTRLSKGTFLFILIGALAIGYFGPTLLQEGPLNTIMAGLGTVLPYLDRIALTIIGGLSLYNAALMIRLITQQRTQLFASPPFLFSLLFLMFFIAENIAVGGNINFYERYVLQVAPFIGIIAYSITKRISRAYIVMLGLLFLSSNGMLWRLYF